MTKAVFTITVLLWGGSKAFLDSSLVAISKTFRRYILFSSSNSQSKSVLKATFPMILKIWEESKNPAVGLGEQILLWLYSGILCIQK